MSGSRSIVLLVAFGLGLSVCGVAEALPAWNGLVGWYDAGDTDANGLPDGLADGTAVSTWVNRANPGTNDGAAVATPTVENAAADVINGQPVIRFTGTSADKDNFSIGSFRPYPDLGGYHVFVVSQSSETDGNNWQRLVSAWDGVNPHDYNQPQNWLLIRPGLISGAPKVYSARIDAGSVASGKSLADVRIARLASAGTLYDGDMGEVILYDRRINSAEQILTRNYLAAKYGLSIGGDDRYAGDETGKGDYDLDVLGIGRVNAASELTTSASAGLAIAESGDTLGDSEWLLAGHKTPVNAWVTTDLPLGVKARWDRVWYVDETGVVDVSMTFNFADGGVAAPTPGAPLDILFSQTNAYDFQRLGFLNTTYGDEASFDVSGALLQDGYYTLAIVPEPTTLSLLTLGALGVLIRRRRRR